MSTPTLSSFQSSLVAALSAAPFFAGVSVIPDDGTKGREQEVALATKGLVLVVSPCLSLRRRSDARVSLDCDGVFCVHIRSNPAVNLNGTTGAGKNLHDAVTQTIVSVIAAHREANATRENVRASQSLATLVEEDSGLLTYSVAFEASLQIAS